MMNSIGTDSEIFARNAAGKAISLCGKIGGSKDEPKPLKNLGRGFAVQEDNVSVEFNIPPCSSIVEWDRFIAATLEQVSNILKSMSLYFSENASISFDKDQLVHPNALIFGCEPDYNAWTKSENSKPRCSDPSLRTAGGHVHVGTRGNMIHCVEMMDLFLGVPSVLLDDSPASVARRQLYGKAGAMRPKPYGFEYRVLSNFWIFKKELREWVYRNTKHAVTYSENILTKAEGEVIQRCINTGDKELAKQLIAKYDVPLVDGVSPAAKIMKEDVMFVDWASGPQSVTLNPHPAMTMTQAQAMAASQPMSISQMQAMFNTITSHTTTNGNGNGS